MGICVRRAYIQEAKNLCPGKLTFQTRKAREDAIPHERGLTPLLPSEFFCPVLAGPNLRFYRSLASRSTPVNQIARLTTKQTVDL